MSVTATQAQTVATTTIDTSEFSTRQEQTFNMLPATAEDIADSLGVKSTTVLDYISQLRNKHGVSISYNSDDGTYSIRTHQHPTNHNPMPGPNTSKASHTKKKKSALLEMQEWLADDLNHSAPPVADGGMVCEESHEDVVIHRSDDHIGAEYEDEFGNYTYTPEIGANRVKAVGEKTLELIHRQKQAGITFDTANLLLGGDTVHGEGIHKNQPWESRMTLIEQIEEASDMYMTLIEKLRHEFETVQVVCQNGNHGELRGDGMSEDANADDIVYMTMDKRIRDRGYQDVTFIRAGGTFYTNFEMRGHQGHLRHGQKSLFHIGTSSGKNRWRGWLNRHNFDIAYRGHFHEFRIENIDSRPVIMSGSVCPPSDFEEGLSAWSEPAATIHGVSDTRPMTWMYPVNFENEMGI